MTALLDLVTPGEILKEEFIEPLGLSASRLARDIDVPHNRILAIIHGKRSITADTALRFGKYFNTGAQFWMNLQMHYDLEKMYREEWPSIESRVRKLVESKSPKKAA